MIEITPHPRKNVRCDIAGCKHPIKPLWINESGSPMPLRFICCETHLKEIVFNGITHFLETIGDEFRNQAIEAIGGLPDGDNCKNESDFESQIKEKDTTIETLKKQLDELNSKLKAANTNTTLKSAPKGRLPKTMKGKGNKR